MRRRRTLHTQHPKLVAFTRSARSAGLVWVFVVVALLCAIVSAQAPDVTGEWDAQYVTPLGPQEVKIYLSQEGPRISGHTTSEFGEFQVRGSINGRDIKLSWAEVDGGKTIDIVVTGTIDGDTITGKASVGGRGEGAFRATRGES